MTKGYTKEEKIRSIIEREVPISVQILQDYMSKLKPVSEEGAYFRLSLLQEILKNTIEQIDKNKHVDEVTSRVCKEMIETYKAMAKKHQEGIKKDENPDKSQEEFISKSKDLNI